LRQTFALLEPKAGIAGLVFYRQLFTLDPSLRKLFQTSIELQSRKLMESLGYTVATLENPEMLVPVLESMGRRHVTYGARTEHYDTVITALMHALEQVLNKDFTREVKQAWDKALKFVAAAMMRGARDYGTTEDSRTSNFQLPRPNAEPLRRK
jgi:hemoglobin-like flavoprotein